MSFHLSIDKPPLTMNELARPSTSGLLCRSCSYIVDEPDTSEWCSICLRARLVMYVVWYNSPSQRTCENCWASFHFCFFARDHDPEAVPHPFKWQCTQHTHAQQLLKRRVIVQRRWISKVRTCVLRMVELNRVLPPVLTAMIMGYCGA
jgi:hypothetical protein